MNDVKLGYADKTAELTFIQPSHLIATGVTQLSGKTTTLEAIIKRRGQKAIVFKTKVGETGFSEGTLIPPYFKERSDWQYVSSLLEATLKERLKFERAWIIHVCQNANSLLEVKANIDRRLTDQKLNQLSRNVYTTLQAYFELVLPQLQYANFSRTLTLHDGINIMNLERFSIEIQSLVIRSVLEIVLNEYKGITVVMPEAWKFNPQEGGNPCKRATEEFIRQGATNENYLFIDSQDMAGVDKTPLKQVSTWILGLQTERNEVEHTLDQISLPRSQKPKPEEIMTLGVGWFILVTPKQTVKVYVQPAWLDDKTAIQVAQHEIESSTLKKPLTLTTQPMEVPEAKAMPDYEARKFYARISQDLIEMRKDFFDKITQVENILDAQGKAIMELKGINREPNINEIVSRVLQKMPTQRINEEEIIASVLQQVPKVTGAITYEVAPLIKLQRECVEQAKNQIIGIVKALDDEQTRILRFAESIQRETNISEIMEKGLFLKAGGGSRSRVQKKIADMVATELLAKNGQQALKPNLKGLATKLLQPHNGTPEEMQALYDHIIHELLGSA